MAGQTRDGGWVFYFAANLQIADDTIVYQVNAYFTEVMHVAINRIEINDFTVFNNITVDACPGVNVLIGENGTGKTHLLKIIYAFCGHEVEREGSENGELGYHKVFHNKLNNYFQNAGYARLAHRHTEHPANQITFDFNVSNDIYNFVITPDFSNNIEIHNVRGIHEVRWLLTVKKAIPSVYIPAKEMLTHSGLEKDFAERNLPFDATHIDILNKVGVSTVKTLCDNMQGLLSKISSIIGGPVLYQNDSYFINKGDKGPVEFIAEAEGFKKYGLLYRLIETGHLKKGSVLLWDEPEANINPKLIPDLVEIILELSRNDVQIFIATHDYMFAKYFEVRRKEGDKVRFHSLHKTGDGVKCEHNEYFRDLKENPIIDAFDMLMDEILGKNLGD